MGVDEQPASSLPPLPDDAILVHIGPHKTGTTSIQSVLAQSRALLRAHDVRYPGKRVAHHREARALRQFGHGWARDPEPPPEPEVWTRFAERITHGDGRVVISSELLAEADAASQAKLIGDLGAGRVHVVTVARNPAGIAASTWQQIVRTFGRSFSLETWLEQSFRRTDMRDTSQGFWQRADPATLVSRWLEVVPVESITVVALDERDRRLLPTAFEQLLGLPPGLLADQQPPQANRGLSSAELALLLQINAALTKKVSWADYTRLMRRGVIQRVLNGRRPGPDEGRPQLPEWAIEQAAAEIDRSIKELRASGVRIAGDLEALRVAPDHAEPGEGPITHVPIDLATEAVLGALAAATRNDGVAARTAPATQQTAASRRADLARIPTRDLATTLARRVVRRARRGRKR